MRDRYEFEIRDHYKFERILLMIIFVVLFLCPGAFLVLYSMEHRQELIEKCLNAGHSPSICASSIFNSKCTTPQQAEKQKE